MKQSMVRRQQRNFNNNRVYNSVRNHSPRFHFVTVATMLMNFGHRVMSFLGSLVTVGFSAYDGLNRGQIRQMWWIQCLKG